MARGQSLGWPVKSRGERVCWHSMQRAGYPGGESHGLAPRTQALIANDARAHGGGNLLAMGPPGIEPGTDRL